MYFKYDGYSLKTFKHDFIKVNSLSGNAITMIIKDSKGNLWIGTRGKGLNHFNTKTAQFSHFRHQDNTLNSISHDYIYSIVEDSQGNLWVGTRSGLNHFNTKTKQFTHYRHQANHPNSLSNDTVRSYISNLQEAYNYNVIIFHFNKVQLRQLSSLKRTIYCGEFKAKLGWLCGMS